MVYQVCTRCIMDTSDPNIFFDAHGVCHHCQNFDRTILPSWKSQLEDPSGLQSMVDQIKADGRHLEYDCIIGLSGGLDSSYASYVSAGKLGLRPLLFHVDAGWNSAQAVKNIAALVDGLQLRLHTHVVDWESVRRIQLAFFKSGIPDLDLVQDAAFFSSLYKYAHKNGIKHVITGSNYSTECCREPLEWGGYLGIDKKLFKDIWLKHGDGGTIEKYPLIDIYQYKLYYQKLLGMKVHFPLNAVNFLKHEAEQSLNQKFSWNSFKHKHHESRFTRFYEDFWLPNRFQFDKRRAHFSSLIITGQMSRIEALERISTSEMSQLFLDNEFTFIAQKLGISRDELTSIFMANKKTFSDFKNKRKEIIFGTKVFRVLGLEKRFL